MKKYVREIMCSDVFAVPQTQDLNFTELMAEGKHVRHVPVLDQGGSVCGMLSTRDFLKHLSKAGCSHFVPVSQLMNPNPRVVSPDTEIVEVVELLIQENISAVPVVDKGKLVGIVSERDLVGYLRSVLKP